MTITDVIRAQRKNVKFGASESDSKAKVTPIHLAKMDTTALGDLSAKLSSSIGADEFFVQRFGDNRYPRVFCKSDAAKLTATTLLNADKIEYNSFNTADSRRKAFIVRGLCYHEHQDGITAISSALAALHINGRVDVSLFETAYLRHHHNAKHSPLFRIVVGSNVNSQLILDIRSIGQYGVRVESMKKSLMVQCHNCQRHHHSSNQCHFEYRCVQCTSPHTYGNCPRASNRALPIGCFNCFDAKLIYTDHTANDFKNCSFFKKATAAKESLRKRGGIDAVLAASALAHDSTTGSRPVANHTNHHTIILEETPIATPMSFELLLLVKILDLAWMLSQHC